MRACIINNQEIITCSLRTVIFWCFSTCDVDSVDTVLTVQCNQTHVQKSLLNIGERKHLALMPRKTQCMVSGRDESKNVVYISTRVNVDTGKLTFFTVLHCQRGHVYYKTFTVPHRSKVETCTIRIGTIIHVSMGTRAQ